MPKLLVADIGGTKTDFAVVDTQTSGFLPLAQGSFENRNYTSCEDVVSACLASFNGRVDFLSLAVAGPVKDQGVSFTNLPWQTDRTALKTRFGFKDVVLVNDLVGFAEGLDWLENKDLVVIKSGNERAKSPKLVVAPGTGLGAALNFDRGQGLFCRATEAGHLSFAPRNELEKQLHAFLQQRFDHVSFEMVCSGTGLENIFSFLQNCGVAVSEELQAQLEKAGHLGPVLAARALDNKFDCPISTQTFEIFFDTLAEFCGNLAVTLLPEGGVYLGGGMLADLAPLLDSTRFTERFTSRGRMRSLVESLSINLITRQHPALLGAYGAGRRVFLI